MLTVCYDLRVLENINSRSGIYFVLKNILTTLLNRNINLYYYIGSCNLEKIKNKLRLDIDENYIKTDKSDFTEINAFLSTCLKIPDFINQFPHISSYTILYDLIPMLLPRYFPAANTWIGKLCNSFNKQNYYFAISNYTKNDFIKYFSDKLGEKHIEVIPLSTNLEYKQNKDAKFLNAVKLKYNIPQEKKYIFSLCSLDPRKNLMRNIKTFINFVVKNKIDDMVYLVGGADVFNIFDNEVREYITDYEKYKDKIIRAGYIDDEDLEVLYSNAEWFVYTSQYEGFGMPPLEAMKCGCPVITSNNSSLPEVVGDSAITIDYDSDLQHIEAYEKYYYNEDLRKEMSQKGLERAKLFSWDNTVNIIINKMKEVEAKKANKPLVTIITATYNLIENGRKEYFLQNLESVQSQTYKNIEHIIIDGASTDGTLELLKEYEQKGLIKYYSEPDKGIYDAINKGILKANGKYVVCLNSDDFYCNNKAVELEVMKLEENDADACYGDTLRVKPRNLKVIREWKGKDNFYPLFGLAPCHQSFMIKTDVMKELGLYNLNYKVSADNNFIARMIQYNKKFVGIDVDIIKFRDGGFSNSNLDISYSDLIHGFWQEYGQYHKLTKLDAYNLFGYNFTNLSLKQAIELGCKIDNQDWQKKYFKILFNHHLSNHNGLSNSKQKRTYRLFNFIPLLKIKRKNNKTKVYLFSILPLLKIKRHNEKDCRVYLLWFIPFLRIKNKAKRAKVYLFSIIPILKIG